MRESTRFESELADLDVTGEFETKTKKAKAAKAPPKPTLAALVRVRCENDHKIPKVVNAKQPIDSWLRRLYVVWAEIGSGGAAAGPFQLGKTDDEGWLRALTSAATPDPTQVQPLTDGVSYLFYFVRHPDEKIAERIRADVSGTAAHSWGSPQTIAVKLETVDKKSILVLRVPERPDAFKPAGSTLYEEWVLFRGMPGSGPIVTGKSLTKPQKSFMQCPLLEKQVRRLQHHLGKFRYWVGTNEHPYSAQPDVLKKKKLVRDSFFNDGYFDVATWNSVLAFQRDADAGTAKVLDSSLTRVPIIDATTYDPLPADTVANQKSDAPNYISSQAATSAQAKQSGTFDWTVVDLVSGDTIKRWLDTDLRKPGPVVVFDAGTRTWVHEGALSSLQAWSKELKRLGFPKGVSVSNTLRDPRIGTSTGGGMIANSIHKSGFALDLSMNWSTGKVVGTLEADGDGIQDAKSEYPLFFEKDTSATGTRVSWKVWARIDDPTKILEPGQLQTDAAGNPTGYSVTDPTKTYVEYAQSITPFVYDPRDDDGGKPGPVLSIPGKLFLNVTKVALQHGFIRIPAHAKGWQRVVPPKTLTIDAAKLADIVKRLDLHRGDVGGIKQKLAANDEFKVNGATFKFASSGATIKQWVDWMALTKALSPAPEVTLHATRTSAEKKFTSSLASSKGLAGLTLTAIDLATGSSTAIVVGKTMSVPAGDITLQLTTIPFTLINGQSIEFPSRIGDPAHMEWWHHQFKAGYSGKKWAALLGEMGWTKEGLLRKADQPGIYGWGGIGLKTADVESTAS